MDNGGAFAGIILFTLLLLTDVVFYGFDTALRGVNEKEIEKRAQENDKRAERLRKIMEGHTVYENAQMLMIVLVNMILVTYYQPRWSGFVEQCIRGSFDTSHLAPWSVPVFSEILSAFVLLYLVLTFGVLLPRRIAARIPEKWAYACVPFMTFFKTVLTPFTGLISVTVSGVLYLFGVRDKGDEADVTEEEIINMVNEGHEQGVIQASEAQMISNIFEYGDKEAQEIMTHRNNIIAIADTVTLREAVDFMLAEKNSRYPVYEESTDHTVASSYLKDALPFCKARQESEDEYLKNCEGLLRDPQYVPQTKNIDELCKEMQKKKLQMVVVIDEYGQTAGLVTMEDILEEIVGNILDEYDEDREYIEEKGDDSYVLDGTTPLKELEEQLDITFGETEFETINGFLISKLDKIPEPDEEFDVDYGGYNFKILSVENKMISSVLVTKLEPETDEESETDSQKESTLEESEK